MKSRICLSIKKSSQSLPLLFGPAEKALSVARRRLFTRRQQQACSNPLSTNFVVFNDDHTDDKRLQNTLKRLGVNNIPGIEEVNEIMDSSLSPPR